MNPDLLKSVIPDTTSKKGKIKPVITGKKDNDNMPL